MLDQLATYSYWAAFTGLLMASFIYALEIVRRRPTSRPFARIITALSWVMLTASIGLSSIHHSGTLLNGSNALVLLAWALVLIYFVLGHIMRFHRYGVALVPAGAFLLFVAQIIAPASGQLAPYPELVTAQMDSAMIGYHVLLITFGNAFMLVGSIAAGLYIYQSSALRSKNPPAFLKSFPPLANIEKLWVRVLSIGLPIYFAGQILGVTRAIVVDAQGWFVDIRIMISGAILIVFSLVLFLYYRAKTDTIMIARMVLFGAVLIIVLMVLARALPSGFHVFGAFN
ncbi:MAG: cytochrome c biogenesis protein CcsA [Coriobacteriia bacterium]|nr:cytochrome c biogenesis protein CcsA [Coriobacteriia bacterium]MCL2537370.1 cytochrome c biogenesis protein CcsA [Coriobacteriia bacterium]